MRAQAPASPYRLIETTSLRWYHRRLSELLLPAVPPALALTIALVAGRLPFEIAVAGAIALAIVGLCIPELVVSKVQAARFLDRSLGAKDGFLTLATIERPASLLPVVEAGVAAVAASAGDPPLPARRKRPLVISTALSGVGLLLLLVIPELASLTGQGGGLDRIAAELAAGDAVDRELAQVLRDVSRTLHDPRRSKEEKRAKIAEALAKLERAERTRRISAAGAADGAGEQESQGAQEKADGNRQERGIGEQASGREDQQQAGRAGKGESDARGQAKKELERIAGEIAGGSQQAKAQARTNTEAKPQPSGGGIQGPETGAKERKSDGREATGNQPGKAPDKPGGDDKPGGEQGEAKAEDGGEHPQRNAQKPAPHGGPGASANGASQKPTSSGDTRPAERYYKPGEGPGAGVIGGQYVRIRVPGEDQALPGTEEVAKPGDVNLEVPYGNAPLPDAGAPGEVRADQPVPLEYREALKPPPP